MTAESLIETHGLLVNVERETEAVDDSGSVYVAEDVPIVASNVRMFIQPRGGDEAVRYGRDNERTFHVVYAKVGTDVQSGDRITGGDLGTRVLEVQSVRKPGEFASGGMAHLVIEAEETAGGT